MIFTGTVSPTFSRCPSNCSNFYRFLRNRNTEFATSFTVRDVQKDDGTNSRVSPGFPSTFANRDFSIPVRSGRKRVAEKNPVDGKCIGNGQQRSRGSAAAPCGKCFQPGLPERVQSAPTMSRLVSAGCTRRLFPVGLGKGKIRETAATNNDPNANQVEALNGNCHSFCHRTLDVNLQSLP